MRWQDHIERRPEVLTGKPVIKGTRIAVELILNRLGDGWKVHEVLRAFPQFKAEHMQASQAYADAVLASDELLFLNEPADAERGTAISDGGILGVRDSVDSEGQRP